MNFETDTHNSTYESGGTDSHHENASDPASELRTTVIFQSSVVIIGIIGVLANGLVIWVHFRSKPEKNRKSSNSLMLNQLFLDLCSLFFPHRHLRLEVGKRQVGGKFECCFLFLDRQREPTVDLPQQLHHELGLHCLREVCQDCSSNLAEELFQKVDHNDLYQYRYFMDCWHSD